MQINICSTDSVPFVLIRAFISYLLKWGPHMSERNFGSTLPRPNFVFHLVFMSFHLEFLSFSVSMKIKPWTSFSLNGLKNGSDKYFKNCIKLLHFFQGLVWHIIYGSEVDPNIFSRHMCHFVIWLIDFALFVRNRV